MPKVPSRKPSAPPVGAATVSARDGERPPFLLAPASSGPWPGLFDAVPKGGLIAPEPKAGQPQGTPGKTRRARARRAKAPAPEGAAARSPAARTPKAKVAADAGKPKTHKRKAPEKPRRSADAASPAPARSLAAVVSLGPPPATAETRRLTDVVADPGLAALPAERPVPRGRALVRVEARLVTRLVAWLDALLPRKKRRALPRVLTRLPRPAALVGTGTAEMVGTAGAPGTGPAPAPGAETLSRQMLIALSEENLRLRRELEALRAARG